MMQRIINDLCDPGFFQHTRPITTVQFFIQRLEAQVI
jgi:hypothetical protein